MKIISSNRDKDSCDFQESGIRFLKPKAIIIITFCVEKRNCSKQRFVFCTHWWKLEAVISHKRFAAQIAKVPAHFVHMAKQITLDILKNSTHYPPLRFADIALHQE